MFEVPDPPQGGLTRPFVEYRAIFRALGVAGDPGKLVVATLGLVALFLGWEALERAFGSATPVFVRVEPALTIDGLGRSAGDTLMIAARQMTEPLRVVIGPFWLLFTRGVGPRGWFQSALMAAWSLTVWGVFGGAIARTAMVQVAIGQRLGIVSALKFALGKSGSLIGAPLTPMVAVGVFSSLLALFGLLARIPWGVGPWLTAALGFIPLLIALVMASILLGLAVGWPLMHATVAAEREDAADALSRSYSYVNQRLVRYLTHALLAWGVGAVGLVVVVFFGRVVLALASWGVGLGAPGSGDLGSSDLGPLVSTFWRIPVAWLVHGWIYSYFWSASSVIYLILRRDVDGTEWNDVSMPEHDLDTFAGDRAS